MKIKNEFILREFADKWIAVSVNDDKANDDLLITLNKSGVFLWELLQEDISYDDILAAAVEKYGVDKEILQKDLDIYLDKLRKANILLEYE